MRKVRMLVDKEIDGVKYKPNQLVGFSDSLAKHLVDAGEADSSRPAVDYCEKELKAELIVHEGAAASAARGTLDQLETELAELKKKRRAEKDAGRRGELDKQIDAAKVKLAEAEADLEKAKG